MKSIEAQIAEALGVEIEECHEYVPELYVFSLKNTTNILIIQLDQSKAILEDQTGAKLRETTIKITLE